MKRSLSAPPSAGGTSWTGRPLKKSLPVTVLVSGFLLMHILRVFPPGSPQPADALLVLTILIFLHHGWIRFSTEDRYLLLFVGYTYLVNLVWTLVLDTGFALLLSSAYFTYNALAYAVFKRYFADHSGSGRTVLWAAMAAMVIEALFVLVRPGEFRTTGTFDNPNQLAYFAICYSCIGLLIADELKTRAWVHTLLLIFGWALSLQALSKAGIGGMLFLTLIILFRQRLVYAVSGLMAASVVIYFLFMERIQRAVERMSSIGQDHDDSLAGRGYDRIWNEYQYLGFGAGEGEFGRHDSLWGGEIHSSFGTVLFCYGVVGLGLFLLFLFRVYKINRTKFLLYCMPVFVYSLTHNGLRTTPFWILLALLACQAERRAQGARQRGGVLRAAQNPLGVAPRN